MTYLLWQIPPANFREIAHLSGREIKTLFSYSVSREIDPGPRQYLHVKMICHCVSYKAILYILNIIFCQHTKSRDAPLIVF